MSLVEHIDGTRRIWNYPRPIRSSAPALYRGIIELLFSNSKYSILKTKEVQHEFSQNLQKLRLKRVTDKPRDKNPGTIRTLIHHLESLFLIFRDPESEKIYTTLCGEKLLNDEDINDVMRYVILSNQYPSSASAKKNVNLHPEIKIKPNVFVLKLLRDQEISSLTAEELFIPIIYGHNSNCFDICKDKILQIRSGKKWSELIDDFHDDLYTPRKGHSDGSDESLKNWKAYLKDITTTIIPLLSDVNLVHDYKESNVRKISLNERFNSQIDKAINEINKIEPYSEEYYESFQRKLGAFEKRDNRQLRKLENSYGKKDSVKISIQNNFFLRKAKNEIIDDLTDNIVKEFSEMYSVDSNFVRSALEPVFEKAYSQFERNLIDCSESGRGKALEFEKLLAELFKKKFGFLVEPTGQIKRGGGHNYSDLYIVDENKKQSIISDAKAIADYSLPIGDIDKIKSYINTHEELVKKYFPQDNINLVLCLFIARTMSSSFDLRAKELHNIIGNVHISGIDIIELIKLSKIKNLKNRQSELIECLKVSGQINSTIFS